jgi:serine/threonine protein kinase
MVGCLIGPYRVVSLIGKGGMGEVYLAQDTRLARQIALKLLSGSLTLEGTGAPISAGSARRFQH